MDPGIIIITVIFSVVGFVVIFANLVACFNTKWVPKNKKTEIVPRTDDV